MKKFRLFFCVLIINFNLFAKDIDKLSDNNLSYYRSLDNVCMPSTVLFKEIGLNTIKEIRNAFKDSEISTDQRDLSGYVQLKLSNNYYTFFTGLDACLEFRKVLIQNLPSSPYDDNKAALKKLPLSYFSYEKTAKSGICEKVNDPLVTKNELISKNGFIINIDETKEIVGVISTHGRFFTKSIEECLKL